MKQELEIFEYLKSRGFIKGIDIDDLYSLLTHNTYKNYTIKIKNHGILFINDKNDINKNILLKCVKDFYKTNQSNCTQIRAELGTYKDETSVPDCAECYKRYIEKIKNGEI